MPDPVSPVIEGLEVYEFTLGGEQNGQPEYLPLPLLHSADGRYLSRWRLTADERAAIAAGADIYLSVQAGQGYPPTMLRVSRGLDSDFTRHEMNLDGEMELRMMRDDLRELCGEQERLTAAICNKSALFKLRQEQITGGAK